MWSEELGMTICLILKQIIRSINLPKVCDPKSQTWPKFCLILKQIIYTTQNIPNKNMAKLPVINNNTSIGYLHSKGVVQYFHLNLLGYKHLYRLSKWYSMALPISPNFYHARFFAIPTTFLSTKSLGANGLSLTLVSCTYLSFCW